MVENYYNDKFCEFQDNFETVKDEERNGSYCKRPNKRKSNLLKFS